MDTDKKPRSGCVIYKICGDVDWREAVANGAYRGSADDVRDGFIHLSTAEQLHGTAAKHFAGKPGLVLVAFDANLLGAALKWEPSRGGDLFPHSYAALDPRQALWVKPMPLGADGIPQLAEDVLKP